MAEDRRIGSLLGGVARSVGPSEQDIRSLERRRDEHARKTAKKPVRAFDEMLDNQREASERDQRRRQEARGEGASEGQEEPPQEPKERSAVAPQRPVLPRGRGRLIRG